VLEAGEHGGSTARMVISGFVMARSTSCSTRAEARREHRVPVARWSVWATAAWCGTAFRTPRCRWRSAPSSSGWVTSSAPRWPASPSPAGSSAIWCWCPSSTSSATG
jgi:hypothetical protein